MSTSHLTDEEREIFGARADILIPESEGMPSATRVRTHHEWIDVALTARPDLLDQFKASLAIGPKDDPVAGVDQVHKSSPEAFDAFSVLTSGAYLMIPEVKALIGYPGQEPRPVEGDDVPEYIDMLEKVVERGPVYRPTVGS
jgi:hypothetical protein